jgi:glutaredoxin 3
MAASVVVYVTTFCPYCVRAKALLDKKGVAYDVVNVDHRDDLRDWLVTASGQRTVPQIFANNRPLGGFTDIAALDRRGELDGVLRQAPPPGLSALPR